MSSSPRSSALLARSKLAHRSSDLLNRLEHNIMPVLMVAAVVVTLVICWMVGDQYAAKTSAWPEVLHKGTVAGALLLLAFAGVAWATAMAFSSSSDQTTRMVLLALFVAVAVAFGVAMWFHFRREDPHHVAFYLMVAVLVAALVHSYLVWVAVDTMGVVGMLPAALAVAFLVYQFWPDSL